METRRRKDTDEPVVVLDTCEDCKNADAQARTAHHFAVTKAGGVDLLKLHLYQFFAQTPRITTEERREKIESLCNWMNGLINQWSGFVDEATGAPLLWYEARRQFAARKDSIAVSAYAQAPERYKEQYPREGARLPAVAGFHRLPDEPTPPHRETTLRRGAPEDHEYIPEPSDYTEDPEGTPDADRG